MKNANVLVEIEAMPGRIKHGNQAIFIELTKKDGHLDGISVYPKNSSNGSLANRLYVL